MSKPHPLKTDWPAGTKFAVCGEDGTPMAFAPDGAGMVDVLLPDGSPKAGSMSASIPVAVSREEFDRAAQAWAIEAGDSGREATATEMNKPTEPTNEPRKVPSRSSYPDDRSYNDAMAAYWNAAEDAEPDPKMLAAVKKAADEVFGSSPEA